MAYKLLPTDRLLWIDLEMTGLDPGRDVIIEAAAVVSDYDFNILDSYQARIKHGHAKLEKLFAANDFYAKQYTNNRDYFLNNLASAQPLKTVEADLVKLAKKYFGQERAVLAGNSIHFDRSFIRVQMPELDKLLHYRMLDVSSWKLVMNNKFGVAYEKRELHQAFADIQESIDELKFYLEWFGDAANLVAEEEEL